MAITPEEIARRFAPPRTEDAVHTRKLLISDLAMTLADTVLAMVPGSREQSRAIEGLELCVQWAHVGIDRRLDTEDDTPVPYALTEEPAGHPEPLDPPEPDKWLWTLGFTHSRLSPLHRLVAYALAGYADQDGHIAEESQPTLGQLRQDTGLMLRDLHFLLRDLHRGGWISRETTRQGSTARTHYQPTLPDGVRPAAPATDTPNSN